jgi:hypothetical protein
VSGPHLVANIGAEEGGAPPGEAALRAIDALAALWRSLFEPPAFTWLAEAGTVAWWNDEAALREATVRGEELFGTPPQLSVKLHDKAFALATTESEGLDPPVLRGLAIALAPAELRAPDAVARIEERVAAWPSWAQRRFTLKPRLGTSGRGRLAGRDGRLGQGAVASLERLATRGGAVLEPWLDRLQDASVQLHVAADGALTLLGSLEPWTTPAGLPLGHRGIVDTKGRIRSGLPEEETLREAAALVGVAAAREGLRGPCGIDAFVFRDPEPAEPGGAERVLRPVVELNARFTLGTVVVGHLRRHLRDVKRTLRLDAGELVPFGLVLAAPAGGWPASEPGALWARALLDDPAGPGLVVARDAAAIDALVSVGR